jgi:hypothetical protein
MPKGLIAYFASARTMMSIVEEVKKLMDYFSPFEIINEYQQGVYYARGVVKPRKVRQSGAKLDEILREEASVDSFRYLIPFARFDVPKGFRRSRIHGGLIAETSDESKAEKGSKPKPVPASPWKSSKFYMLFYRGKAPEGYKRSWIHGGLLSEKRYTKNLTAGCYVRWPIFDDIVKEDVKVRNEGLEEVVRVPLSDSCDKVITLGGNLRYKITDLDKALNEVKDYKRSLSDQVLSILAKHSWGQDYKYWQKKENIEILQDIVTKEVSKIVKKWGIDVELFYITKCAIGPAYNIFNDGNLVSPSPLVTLTNAQ